MLCSSGFEESTGGTNLHFPAAATPGSHVLGQALRVQTLEQFGSCQQVPAGPVLPRRGRDGFKRPLGAEATQRFLWAHRLATHLSTSFLSWLKHQLPLEVPCLAHPTKTAPQSSASTADHHLPKTIQINCALCCMLSPIWLTSARRMGTTASQYPAHAQCTSVLKRFGRRKPMRP